jgi:hypothetical protein
VIGPVHPYGDETLTIVDGPNPPTTVTLLDGALVGDVNGEPFIPIGLDVFGQSQVRMLGGGIGGVQQAILLHDDSLFHMLMGRLDVSGIELRDNATAILEDGYWGRVGAYGSSRVRVNGGEAGSTFHVSTFGQSHVAINSEKMHFRADEFSTMVINAGFFEGAEVLGNAEVLVNGGSFITGLQVSDNAVVRIRDIMTITEEYVDVRDNAVVNFYGTNLRFDILRIDEDDVPVVRGNWPDGDSFAIRYRLFDQGQIILHEVPEPAAWALLAVGAVGLFAWRRARFAATRR